VGRDVSGTLSYYLASAFREVWMQRQAPSGLSVSPPTTVPARRTRQGGYRGQVSSARGEYKVRANLFTQDRYTDAHREADGRLIESLHTQVWKAVAASRHLEPAEG